MQLLSLLQARREWTGSELRDRLEVSDRTLRRDIDDLRELGYGVEATRGVGGGYRLGAGASVPPLALAQDEAVAIAVGLRSATGHLVTGLEEASARALGKLEQSLSKHTRDHIVAVGRSMTVLTSPGDPVDVDLVADLAAAIGDTRELDLEYRRGDGTDRRLRAQPHRIMRTTRRWYLVAWDPELGEWRTLRIDRITSARTLRTTFAARDVPEDELRRFTTRSITTDPYPVRATVRMHAPVDVVRRAFGPTVAQVEEIDAESSMLTAGTRRAEEMALYLGTSGIAFEVVEGDELREALLRLADLFRVAAEQPSLPFATGGSPTDDA